MDPLDRIRNGFANGYPTHSHFYAVYTSRHESSMIPTAYLRKGVAAFQLTINRCMIDNIAIQSVVSYNPMPHL